MSVYVDECVGHVVSGQKPAHMQGTGEQAAWAILPEQLPKPALLAEHM